MEEEKAAAYYEELTRKGEGAARFKQGLGFSSTPSSSDAITKGSALPSSSSFLSSFVRASSPTKSTEIDKQIQLEKIQNKLKKKHTSERDGRGRDEKDRDRDRDRERSTRRKSRSRSRDRYDRGRDRGRSEGRRRSRSRSRSDEERRGRRSSRERRNRGRRSRSRSSSPRDRKKSEKSRDEGKSKKERNGVGVDYSKLIKGYSEMSAAERVKAKMKLQLSQTAEKDTDKGMGAGWERFDFNKDAPLDDEDIEAVEDDTEVVKKMGQSFRFNAVQARREEQIQSAHDQAMFGAPIAQPTISADEEPATEDEDRPKNDDNLIGSGNGTDLISEKVLAKQQGSWRDRARKLKDG